MLRPFCTYAVWLPICTTHARRLSASKQAITIAFAGHLSQHDMSTFPSSWGLLRSHSALSSKAPESEVTKPSKSACVWARRLCCQRTLLAGATESVIETRGTADGPPCVRGCEHLDLIPPGHEVVDAAAQEAVQLAVDEAHALVHPAQWPLHACNAP